MTIPFVFQRLSSRLLSQVKSIHPPYLLKETHMQPESHRRGREKGKENHEMRWYVCNLAKARVITSWLGSVWWPACHSTMSIREERNPLPTNTNLLTNRLTRLGNSINLGRDQHQGQQSKPISARSNEDGVDLHQI